MKGLVRSASLTHYAEIARSLNVDPLQQLRLVGLDPHCLLQPDLKIPVEATARLLDSSARAAGVEDFGLRLAESRNASNLGPLALLWREPTLRAALVALQEFLCLHNQGLVLDIEESGGVVVLRLELVTVCQLSVRQSVELAVAVTHRTLKSLLGNHWHPSVVCFRHCAPRDDSRHHRVFGTSVQFNCLMDGIICRSSDLDRALPSADPEMARHVNQYLNSIREDSRTALLGQVHQMIWTLLPTGRCSVEQVAAHLGRDRRTLHRQLTREGETFSSLLDQVRTELATRYLKNPHHPLSEIAGVLGFSELSAFSRWFSRLFKCSPSSWRTRPSSTAASKQPAQLFRKSA
ncbi:AraC family transcriptional regulator [Pseudomonas fluorescens]|uniref:HTH-type transcriptional regulator VirS n=1 Tax=Pseudomonas fluorescens TaxID=294 RepID=A0A5E7FHA0_PSEFL|nr:AraC family transcriptional regulator [Pseudomonas fluorescens]VVO38576.1 HTH-type transcriptional regulator VirS [Pseudomonas fluorescens]